MFFVLIRGKAGDLLFPSHAGYSSPVWVTEPLWYLIQVSSCFPLAPRSQVLLIEKIRSSFSPQPLFFCVNSLFRLNFYLKKKGLWSIQNRTSGSIHDVFLDTYRLVLPNDT